MWCAEAGGKVAVVMVGCRGGGGGGGRRGGGRGRGRGWGRGCSRRRRGGVGGSGGGKTLRQTLTELKQQKKYTVRTRVWRYKAILFTQTQFYYVE